MVTERMSKEEFIKNLKKLKEDDDYYRGLNDLSHHYNREDEIFITPNSFMIALELLEKAIGDKYEYVQWWCFEKDWGERGPEFCVKDKDDNVIPTETMEDIYDLVTKNLEKENE